MALPSCSVCSHTPKSPLEGWSFSADQAFPGIEPGFPTSSIRNPGSHVSEPSPWFPQTPCRMSPSAHSCFAQVVRAQSLQSYPTLCGPMGCSPPGSSVHRILQLRIQEWVTMPSSRGSSWPRDQSHLSYVSCIVMWVLYHYCHLGSPYHFPFASNFQRYQYLIKVPNECWMTKLFHMSSQHTSHSIIFFSLSITSWAMRERAE